MYLIWYLLFCLLISYVMASILKKNFEECIITVHLGIIIILYFFYLFDILKIGFYIVYIGFALAFVYSIYLNKKYHKLKDTITLMFRPSMLIYFILLFIIYFTVKNNIVSLIDELHLWGVYPKILMHQNGASQLKNSLLLGYNEYIPGVPLYLFFLECSNGSFNESILYFGYAALSSAMMLPSLSKISNFKKWFLFPIIISVFYFYPLAFFNTLSNDCSIFYRSIHVDPILGITAGYGTWLLIQKPWKNKFQMLNFSFCLSFLVLIKLPGIIFSGILIISIILFVFFYEKNILRKWYVWIGLSLPLIIYATWEISLKIFITSDSNFSKINIFDLSFIKEFLLALLSQSIVRPRVESMPSFYTFVSIMLWLISLFIVWWLIIRNEASLHKKLIKWAFATIMAQIIMFVIALYGLCVKTYNSQIPSLPRYLCTALVALLSFYIMIFISEFDTFFKSVKALTNHRGKRLLVPIIICDILLGVIFLPLHCPENFSYNEPLRDANNIKKIVQKISSPEKESSQPCQAILIVDKSYNTISHDNWWYLLRRLYFNFIDENVIVSDCIYTEDLNSKIIKKTEEYLTLSPEIGWGDYFSYVYWIHCLGKAEKTITIYKVKPSGECITFQQILNSVIQ